MKRLSEEEKQRQKKIESDNDWWVDQYDRLNAELMKLRRLRDAVNLKPLGE